jgi:hypothetical protein
VVVQEGAAEEQSSEVQSAEQSPLLVFNDSDKPAEEVVW